MTAERKLVDLDLDTRFLRGIANVASYSTSPQADPSASLAEFRRSLSRVVAHALALRSVDPRRYRGVVRRHLDRMYIHEESGAAFVHKALVENHIVLSEQAVAFLATFRSFSKSLSVRHDQQLDGLIDIFQLRLLAAQLSDRERIIILEKLAHQDQLTGLLNRHGLGAFLKDLLNKEPQASGALIVADIDLFKKVNDERGHDVGDLAIRFAADAFVDSIRLDPDVFGRIESGSQLDADEVSDDGEEPVTQPSGRFGGEEFVGLLQGVPNEEVGLKIAERIRSRVERESAKSVDQGGLGFQLTLTLGVTVGPFADYTGLFKTADEALLEGKRGGRNRVVGKTYTKA